MLSFVRPATIFRLLCGICLLGATPLAAQRPAAAPAKGPPQTARSMLEQAAAHRNQQQWQPALALLDKVRARADFGKDLGQRLDTWLITAQCAFQHKEYARGETAVAEVLRAIETRPAHPEAGAYASQCALGLDQFVWLRHCQSAEQAVLAGKLSREDAIRSVQNAFDDFQQKLMKSPLATLWRASGELFLAELCWRMQNYTQMDQALERARVAASDTGFGLPRASRYWNLLGLCQGKLGDFELAYASMRRSLLMRQEPSGWSNESERRRCEAECLNNLGEYLLKIGDHAAAQRELQAARRLFAEIRDYQSPALANTPLTAPLNTLINLAEAIKRGEQSPPVADDIALLGEALVHFRRPEQNRPISQLVLHAMCLNNLAMRHYQKSDYKTAATLLAESRQLVLRALPENSPGVGESDVNHGWIALSQKDPATAEQWFRNALAKFRAAPAGTEARVGETLGYLARAALLQDRPAEAIKLIDEAVRSEERRIQDKLVSAISDREQAALVLEARRHAELSDWPGAFDTYLELAPQLNISPADQYNQLLRWKGVLARHALRTDRSDADRQMIRQREDLLQQLRELAAKQRVEEKPEGKPNAKDVQAMIRLEGQAHDLQRALRKSSLQRRGEFGQGYQLADIASALPESSALVDVIKVNRNRAAAAYLGFVVQPDGSVQRIEFGEAAAIDAQMARYYDHISRPIVLDVEARGNLLESGLWLRDHLRRPLEHAAQRASVLIVVPDGDWHRLPLAAIPANSPDDWFPAVGKLNWRDAGLWLQSRSFAEVLSAHSLVDRRRRPAAAPLGWLVAGGTQFPGGQDRLEEAQAQVEFVDAALRKRFPQGVSKVLLNDKASKPDLLAGLSSARLAHLVTHGRFDPAHSYSGRLVDLSAQLDSALILPASKDTPLSAQFRITADELRELPLERLDLLVLSACEAGLGHAQDGQGLVGLLGALDRAGARTVLSARWQVSEQHTFALWKEFYRHLLDERSSAAEALRSAQLMQLEQTGTRAGPFYWAGFGLSGDPGITASDQGRR